MKDLSNALLKSLLTHVCVCERDIFPSSGNLSIPQKGKMFSLPEFCPLNSGGCHVRTGCQWRWLSDTKGDSVGGVRGEVRGSTVP